jgi:hypothetical protein
MTIRFSPATTTQYVSCPDGTNLTYPNADWSLSWVMVIDVEKRPQDPQYIISNGAYGAAGTVNVAYQLFSGQWVIKVYANGSQSQDGASTSAQFGLNNYASGAHLFVLQRSNGVISLRSCPILSTAPTDTAAVITAFTGYAMTVALDGPSGMFIGGRADLATNRRLDQSIARVFSGDFLVTDAELAQLAYGKEITDLGKTPRWYVRMDTATDLTDRGTGGNKFTATGGPVTGTSPGFGYTGGGSTGTAPSISDVPTISGTVAAGSTVTVVPAAASGSPTPTLSYQWYLDNVSVSGATGTSFALATADVGKALTVQEIASNGVGTAASATSAASTVAAATGTILAATAMAAAGVRRGFQRVSGVSPVPMAGTYTGAAPSAIEYQLFAADGSTVLKAWTALPSPAISAGTWSASPSIAQGGMYRAQFRSKDSSGVVTSTTSIDTGLFGVGDFFGFIGSSTAENYFTASGSGTAVTPAANVGLHQGGAWIAPTNTGAGYIILNYFAALSGIPVFGIAYGKGYTVLNDWTGEISNRQWAVFVAAVAAVGGKLTGVIGTGGSNDVANNDVSSAAEFLRKLRLIAKNCRTITGNATLPIVWRGFNRRTGVSDVLSDYVRTSEQVFGGDANVYHVQALDLELSGDGTHLSIAGATADCTRISRVAGPVLYGSGTYQRGPKITAIEYNGSSVRITLAHRGGTDFTPASNITGFTASDTTGALTIVSAVRTSATQIVLTMDRAIVDTPVVKYLSGAAPAVGTQVFDNSTAILPMSVEPYMVATAMSAQLATTVTFSVVKDFAGTVADNVTGLDYAIYEAIRLNANVLPIKYGSNLAISNGVVTLDITGATTLTPGGIVRINYGPADGSKIASALVAVS